MSKLETYLIVKENGKIWFSIKYIRLNYSLYDINYTIIFVGLSKNGMFLKMGMDPARLRERWIQDLSKNLRIVQL